MRRLIFVALLLTGCANTPVEPEFMFVQTSAAVASDPVANTVRLVDVTQHTLYFSDRPDRYAGHIRMDEYMNEWSPDTKDNFTADPPNATLSVYEPGTVDNAIAIIEISNPIIDGDDLIYEYKLLDGVVPEIGGEATLFIDRVGPGGGVGAGFHGVGVGERGPGVCGWGTC